MTVRMFCSRVGLLLMILFGSVGLNAQAAADDPLPPASAQLVISSFKATTDSKFITLYNATNMPINLGNVTLNYYTYDVTKDAASSPATYSVTNISGAHSLQLAGMLSPGGYYVVNDGLLTMCYQAAVDAASLSFSTTAGSLQVLDANAADGKTVATLPVVDDSIGWAKYTVSNIIGMQLLPASADAFLQRNQADNTWQSVAPTDSTDSCSLSQLIATPGTGTAVASDGTDDWQLPGSPDIPASIISLASTATVATTPKVPAADVGLAAPQITELLPNPMGTGTDNTNEFIELYNPNSRAFDLTGFVLQTGLTTKHSYTFTAGTSLPPKAFKAFYSADTGLSLSNTSGQADLADPFGKVISQTAPYGSAKDGQAWAFAKGTWYWTGKPTPAAANVVDQSTSIKTTSTKKAAAAVKGASVTTPLQGSGANTAATAADTDTTAPTHPYVLVALAALAVGYGVYEYRHDIANKFHQFRANRKAR